jgi:hypothetical protein
MADDLIVMKLGRKAVVVMVVEGASFACVDDGHRLLIRCTKADSIPVVQTLRVLNRCRGLFSRGGVRGDDAAGRNHTNLRWSKSRRL